MKNKPLAKPLVVIGIDFRYETLDDEYCDTVHIASSFELAEDWIRKNTDWSDSNKYVRVWWAAYEYIVDKSFGVGDMRFYKLDGTRVDNQGDI